MHGGRNKGTKHPGNKHAVTHGLYERLFPLTEEEQALYAGLDASSEAVIERSLRLAAVRELRMLRRLDALAQRTDAQGLIVVDEDARQERRAGDKGKALTRADLDALGFAEADEEPAHEETLRVVGRTTRRALALDREQKVEDSLTALAGVQARLLAERTKREVARAVADDPDAVTAIINDIHRLEG